MSATDDTAVHCPDCGCPPPYDVQAEPCACSCHREAQVLAEAVREGRIAVDIEEPRRVIVGNLCAATGQRFDRATGEWGGACPGCWGCVAAE